jgi:hypothetical protein
MPMSSNIDIANEESLNVIARSLKGDKAIHNDKWIASLSLAGEGWRE